MSRIECERSGNGMLVKLPNSVSFQSARGKPSIAWKPEAYPILFLLYKSTLYKNGEIGGHSHEILNIILAR